MVNIITLNMPFVTQIKHILIMSTSSIRHPKFFSKVTSCVWGLLLAICVLACQTTFISFTWNMSFNKTCEFIFLSIFLRYFQWSQDHSIQTIFKILQTLFWTSCIYENSQFPKWKFMSRALGMLPFDFLSISTLS
jgi:hypothetical protein